MRLSDKVAFELYPGSNRRPFDTKTLASPDVVVLVARTHDGTAAGCCSLFMGANNTAELKRMIVRPRFRGIGVAEALLASLCDVAAANAITTIQLEVGIKNAAAQKIYQLAGFRDRGPFAKHKASPDSRFMEKKLRK